MDAKGYSFFCSKLAAFFESLESWREAAPELDVESALTQIEYDDLLKGTNAHIYVPLLAQDVHRGT